MTPPPVPPPGPNSPIAEGLAPVYDLALARARRSEPPAPPLPAPVLDEMEAASRMFDALRAQGHELRFEREGGRVRAELRTVGGDVVRRVPLTEAVDVTGDPDSAA